MPSKRVLVIAYFYPPLANSGTQRPLKFTTYLREFGWNPTVVAGAPVAGQPVDMLLGTEVPADVTVSRVHMLNDAIAKAAAPFVGAHVARGLAWRTRSVFQRPDIFALWRRPAVRESLRLHAETPFDVVFATGYPWTGLLVGLDVARAARIPLIADFRDPWRGDDVFVRAEKVPTSWKSWMQEQTIVREAAAVVSVSGVMTEQMRLLHPHAPADRFVTIYNGFDPADFRHSEPSVRPRGNKLRVVYAGVWKATYGPSVIYEALRRLQDEEDPSLERLEVVTAGYPPGPALEFGISERVSELGVLSHADAITLTQSADLLFAAIAPGSYQKLALPGKVFEYLASGVPVLATADPDGEVARLFGRVGGGVVIPPDVDQLGERLKDLARHRTAAWPPLDRTALARFERRNLAGELGALLDGVVQAARA